MAEAVTAITERPKDGVSALAPRESAFCVTLDEAKRIAESDLVPKDFRNKPGNVMVAIQMGHEVGLQPMQAIQNIAVINGRPCLWGDAVLALAMAHPLCEYIQEATPEEVKKNQAGKCTVKRKGMPPVIRTFSMEDAQAAGLAKKAGPWTQYPQRMLQMRARSFAIRDAFPDILKGLSVAEEVREIIDVTPEPAEEAQPEKRKVTLFGKEYETNGVTAPTLKDIWQYSKLIDKELGKGRSKREMHDLTGAESSLELTEAEGKRVRIALAQLMEEVPPEAVAEAEKEVGNE